MSVSVKTFLGHSDYISHYYHFCHCDEGGGVRGNRYYNLFHVCSLFCCGLKLKALIVVESYRRIFKARYSKKDLIIKKSVFRKNFEK